LKRAIVGRWIEEGTTDQLELEFFADQSFVMKHGEERLDGKWNLFDKNRIKVEITRLGRLISSRLMMLRCRVMP
jgi:hypothetical protein